MSLLTHGGMIITAYLVAGRAGAIAACLFVGMSPWETLITVMLIDLFQIPVYGLTLETSRKVLALPERFEKWVQRRSERFKARFQENGFWQKTLRIGPAALVMVSIIPLPGFGILSACILAVMLGYGRAISTGLIMIGSFAGSLALICAIFFPGKYFGVL